MKQEPTRKYYTWDDSSPCIVAEAVGPLPVLPASKGPVSYRISMIKAGLPIREFDLLKTKLGVTDDRLGELLGMSRATLHRRKKAGHLDRLESDPLMRFGRLLEQAADAFGGEAGARSWLTAPAIAFLGDCPLDFADTETGAREVEDLIGRLEHGVFS